jgi:hypothetical protein
MWGGGGGHVGGVGHVDRWWSTEDDARHGYYGGQVEARGYGCVPTTNAPEDSIWTAATKLPTGQKNNNGGVNLFGYCPGLRLRESQAQTETAAPPIRCLRGLLVDTRSICTGNWFYIRK